MEIVIIFEEKILSNRYGLYLIRGILISTLNFFANLTYNTKYFPNFVDNFNVTTNLDCIS